MSPGAEEVDRPRAGDATTDGPDAQGYPRIAGRRITDLAAVAGGAVWTGLQVTEALGTVDDLLALALLVFVPLGLGVAATPDRDGTIPSAYRVAVLGQFPAATLAVVSLSLPVGSPLGVVLVLPWLGVAGSMAVFGLRRLLPRGLRPLPELAVDAALLYVVVGAVALVLHRADVPLGFPSIIVLLTVIHYHYAGFALPLITGMAGRVVVRDGRLPSGLLGRTLGAATVVVIVNLALIAVGITFSPRVEVVAVAVFAAAVAALAGCILTGVVPLVGRLRGALLVVASLSVVATMALALAYGYSAYPGTRSLIDIGGMVRYHGTVNAFGFVLPGLLAWRIGTPDPAAAPPGIPFSRLSARRRVGADFFDRNGLRTGAATGMVGSFDSLEGRGFDAGAVHPAVRRFYEDSSTAVLEIRPEWAPLARPLLHAYAPLATRVEQLSLPTEPQLAGSGLASETFGVDGEADGRGDVRAWTRTYPDGTAMYAAAYAVHDFDGVAYLDVAFPLPGGNLTGVLRPRRLAAADGPDGLLLTTRGGPESDAGLYLSRGGYGFRLPLEETIRVWSAGSDVGLDSPFASADEDVLLARHDVRFAGRTLVTLHYRIRP